MTLCGSSRGVFESKRATCLRDKAFPSIGSTKQLPHCQSRTSCLLAKSWHHHVVVHQRAPGISSAPTLTTATLGWVAQRHLRQPAAPGIWAWRWCSRPLGRASIPDGPAAPAPQQTAPSSSDSRRKPKRRPNRHASCDTYIYSGPAALTVTVYLQRSYQCYQTTHL